MSQDIVLEYLANRYKKNYGTTLNEQYRKAYV